MITALKSRSARAMRGAAALIFLIGAMASPAAVHAQVGLTITTPFPSVIVQPGGDVTFDLTVSAEESARVQLSLEGLPDTWSASLSGGGNEITAVQVAAGEPASVSLAVNIAPDAGGEPVTLTVVGEAGDETARLELDLIPASGAGGTVNMEAETPVIQGTRDEEFSFSVDLHNDTPQELSFSLEAAGPRGWQVTAEPSGDEQAAQLIVGARSTGQIDVTATAPAQATAGRYSIGVRATSGDYQATTELGVELTGSIELQFTTPDERLSTTANAGSTRDFSVVVVNVGTAPIEGIELSGSGPSEWEISFDPASIESLQPGDSTTATARITPSGNAVAGDYVTTLTAATDTINETMDVRVTVETAPVWGIVGIGLIVAVVAGMAWIFRRYGRR